MEMAAACALAIISGRIILNFGFQESLRTFLKPIFTGGVWNELPQSKPDDFASFLGEGASGAPANFAAKVQSGLPVSTPSVLPLRGNPHSPFCRYATSSPGRGKSALKGTAFGGGDKVSGIAIRRPPWGSWHGEAVPEGVVSHSTKKAAAEAAAFFDYSMRASQKPYAVRGKGSTSRMFWMPVRYMIIRSKPRP